MIESILNAEGRACPVITCDVCANQLKNGRGIYVYAWKEDRRPLHFTCKGNCDAILRKRLGDKTCWGELSALVGFLAHNAGITPKKMERAMAIAEGNWLEEDDPA